MAKKLILTDTIKRIDVTYVNERLDKFIDSLIKVKESCTNEQDSLMIGSEGNDDGTGTVNLLIKRTRKETDEELKQRVKANEDNEIYKERMKEKAQDDYFLHIQKEYKRLSRKLKKGIKDV